MTDINTVDQITSEVDLFGLILQQTMLLIEFNREFAPLASLQHGAPIEFIIKGADNPYLDLNESLLLLRFKITNADNSCIGAVTAGPVNLTLNSLFSQMNVEFNGKPVSEPNHLYPYRAYHETLINYSEETKNIRPLCGEWTKVKAEHMYVTDVAGANVNLLTRAGLFARNTVVELIGRPNLDVF